MSITVKAAVEEAASCICRYTGGNDAVIRQARSAAGMVRDEMSPDYVGAISRLLTAAQENSDFNADATEYEKAVAFRAFTVLALIQSNDPYEWCLQEIPKVSVAERRGRGRPVTPASEKQSERLTVYFTEGDAEYVRERGGSAYINELVQRDRAAK